MSAPTAKVVRDGQVVQLPGREVTVGDVVVLEAGDSICADGRLLECASLKCAESALTGESLPVEKDLADIDGDVPLGRPQEHGVLRLLRHLRPGPVPGDIHRYAHRDGQDRRPAERARRRKRPLFR